MSFYKDNGQADIDFLCKKHNIGRYDLVMTIRKVCDFLECSPHDALKKLIEVNNLQEFLNSIDQKNIEKEFKRQLRGKRL